MYWIIIYAVIAALIILSIIGLIVRNSRSHYSNIVYDHQGIGQLAICSVFYAVIIFALCKAAVELSLAFVLTLSAIGLICILGWVCMFNEVTFFYDERIVVRNFLGVKKEYHYEDIQNMHIRSRRRRYRTFTTVYFYIGEKKAIKTSSTLANHNSFIDAINKNYKKAHNGQTIPLV